MNKGDYYECDDCHRWFTPSLTRHLKSGKDVCVECVTRQHNAEGHDRDVRESEFSDDEQAGSR